MFLFRKKKEIVGIDIGSTSVKLVQLKALNDTWQLVAAGLIPLPPETIVDNSMMDSAAIVDAISNLMKSLGLKSKDVCCSVSGNSVIIRKIVLPTMQSEELEEQISWEAEQYIPFDINDVNLDFQILAPDSIDPSKMSVLLVASKKEVINDYVAVFNQAGMNLSVVDVDSFAVQNAFEMNYVAAPDDVVALVNIGASVMNINVVKDNITLFTRDVQVGGNLYTEEIQKQMGISAEEAESCKKLADELALPELYSVIDKVNISIIQEIRRSLDYYNSSANDDRITRVFFSGGGSKICRLKEAVASRLDLLVDDLDPFARLKVSDKEFDAEYLREIGPLMAVAVGLAVRKGGDK